MIHRFASLDSTMTRAAELADGGAAPGTVVVADEQTAGKGRMGRAWHSEPGAGLYATFILHPRLSADTLPVVTLALGLATVDAIREVTGAACDLRWPNDVLIGDRKCAGILAQLHDSVLLAGIGINVNHTAFPEDIAPIATSLRIETGRVQSREDLLNALRRSIDERVSQLARGGKDDILRAFTAASSYVSGKRVVVDSGGSDLRGTTDGLDRDGFLMVRRNDGSRVQVVAGGVRPECS
jgi:BirA family transcriptional regulator, biotin operon repressor / biotin---[acetyl-CoA-carboxylase] ligase